MRPRSQHDDLVAVADGAEPMRDDDAVQPRRRTASSISDFGRGIERARRFVEHENRRLADQRPRDLQPLTLSAAEVAAAFLHGGLIALVARFDHLVDRRVAAGLRDARIRDGRVPHRARCR